MHNFLLLHFSLLNLLELYVLGDEFRNLATVHVHTQFQTFLNRFFSHKIYSILYKIKFSPN